MRGLESRARSLVIAVAIVAAVLCAVSNAARRDLFVGDETRYAKIADEMWSHDELVIPTLNGQRYSDKPPAFFWFINVFRLLFTRPSEWTLLLPALVSYAAAIVGVCGIGRCLVGGAAAAFAAFVFATTRLSWIAGQIVRMDMTFAAALGAGFGLLYVALERGNRRLLFCAAAAFGAATLFKGPVAVLLVFIYLLLARRWRSFGAATWILALLLSLAPLAAWLGAAHYAAGSAFVEDLVMRQTLGRALAVRVHAEPPWFYALRLPAILFPWFFPLVVAVAAFVRRERDQWTARERFLVDWMLAVVLSFSAIGSKLEVYLLPMAIPAAVLLGAFAVREAGVDWVRRARMACAVAFLVVLAAVAFVLAREYGPGIRKIMLADPGVRASLALCGGVAIVSMLLLLRERSIDGAFTTLGVGTLAVLILLSATAIPRINEIATSNVFLDVLARYGRSATIRLYAVDTYVWSEDRHALSESIRYSKPDSLRSGGATDDVVVAKASTATGMRLTEQGYREVAEVRFRDRPWLVLERTAPASQTGGRNASVEPR